MKDTNINCPQFAGTAALSGAGHPAGAPGIRGHAAPVTQRSLNVPQDQTRQAFPRGRFEE